MNVAQMSKNDKKKTVKNLPSIDLNTIAIRPPNPPPIPPHIPTINNIVSARTPSRIESPRDDTEILVNGRVMNVDSEMKNRIRADSDDEISPETPPKYNRENNYKTTESNLTPNRYIPNEIKIIESPNNSRYDIKPLPMREIAPAPRPRRETPPEVETVYSDNDSPKSAFTSFTTKTMKTTKTATTNRSSKSLFNMLPKFNKTAAPSLPAIKSNTPDTLPRVKSPANPYQFIQDIKNPQEPEEEYDEDDSPISEDEMEDPAPVPPVRIPIPVFNTVPRVVSPVQTIGPQSPSFSKYHKPMFSEHGKSSTPRRAPSPIRAKTPPPIFRSPPKRASSPAHEQAPRQDIKTPQTQVPKDNYFYVAPQQSSGLTGRPDYSRLTPPQILYLKSEFKVKFGILREKFPNLNVIELHESLDLDQMHDLYDYYIKHILISKETGQYKAYMVIFLMFIEVIGVKLLKLNMSGYTISQLKIINRYDSLFAELGEKWLVSGGSGWPVEARLMMMMLFNAVIFLVVRYLCSWLGVEGLADTLQNMIDKMLNGPDIMGSVVGGSAPVGAPPSNNYVPTEEPHVSQEPEQTGGANPIDGIMNAFSGFLSKNGSSITETIANIGTSITGKMQNNNNVNKTNATKAKEPPASSQAAKKKKKPLFSED